MSSICVNCKYYGTCGDDDRTEYCHGYEAKENRYPEHIIEILRQRLGLDEDDTSRDTEINAYSPNEAFEEMCNWEGFLGYADTIKGWIDDIYGIDLDSVETETEEEPEDNTRPYYANEWLDGTDEEE